MLGVQARVRFAGRVELAPRLGHGPAAGGPVDGEDGPSCAVLVAEVNEQRFAVVLDAQAMGGVALLVERAPLSLPGIRDERGPMGAGRAMWSGQVGDGEELDKIAVGVGHLDADEPG